jgi:hypothetical protein
VEAAKPRTLGDSPLKRTLPLLLPPLRALYRIPLRSLEGPVLPSARPENAGGLNLISPAKIFCASPSGQAYLVVRSVCVIVHK